MNKNAIPGDQRSPMVTSGLRLGTAAVTTRGFGRDEIKTIADVIVGLVRGADPEQFAATGAALVAQLLAKGFVTAR